MKKYILFASCLISFTTYTVNATNLCPLLTVLSHEQDENTALFKVSHKEQDFYYTDYLQEELRETRENFFRINSMDDWDKVRTIKDTKNPNITNTIFYSKQGIEKIIVQNHADLTPSIVEYYLRDNNLSFIYNKALEQEQGTHLYVETKSYFINNILVHQIDNQDCGSPFSDEFLAEEGKHLLADYHNLQKIINSN